MNSSLSPWLGLLGLLLFTTGCVLPPGLMSRSNPSVEVESGNDLVVSTALSEDSRDFDQWRYLEFEGPICANGTPVGMGLNRGKNPNKLVIYLNGGGGCWDSSSCNLFRTAANLDIVYSETRLGEELYPLVKSGLLDREGPVDVWSDASIAFIPYCTGDLHSGRTTTRYNGFGGERDTHHVGAKNLEVFLEYLSGEFTEVEELWIVGISAGGYGGAWNFHHFRDAFAGAEIHGFFDASVWLPLSKTQWRQWQQNWGLITPPGCVMCEVSPDYLIRYLVESHPRSRFAMSVFERDATLSVFTKTLPLEMEKHVEHFFEEHFVGPNTASFVATGSDHEALLMLDQGLLCKEGQELSEFLVRWARGEVGEVESIDTKQLQSDTGQSAHLFSSEDGAP